MLEFSHKQGRPTSIHRFTRALSTQQRFLLDHRGTPSKRSMCAAWVVKVHWRGSGERGDDLSGLHKSRFRNLCHRRTMVTYHPLVEGRGSSPLVPWELSHSLPLRRQYTQAIQLKFHCPCQRTMLMKLRSQGWHEKLTMVELQGPRRPWLPRRRNVLTA